MSVYPKWMEKRKCKISVEIPVYPEIPTGGGGGGGGFTIAYRDRPFPKVTIKKVIVMDEYEHINIKVLKVFDLSFSGGT